MRSSSIAGVIRIICIGRSTHEATAGAQSLSRSNASIVQLSLILRKARQSAACESEGRVTCP